MDHIADGPQGHTPNEINFTNSPKRDICTLTTARWFARMVSRCTPSLWRKCLMSDDRSASSEKSESRVEATQHTNGFDNLVARSTQALSQRFSSRRSLLGWIAKTALALTGASIMPALPFNREVQVAEAQAPNCNEWYMCGAYIDRTCQCACGSNNCPSGTQQEGAWTACCWNPGIGARHLVTYWDCCKTTGNGCCSNSGCECYRGTADFYCNPKQYWRLCCSYTFIGNPWTC